RSAWSIAAREMSAAVPSSAADSMSFPLEWPSLQHSGAHFARGPGVRDPRGGRRSRLPGSWTSHRGGVERKLPRRGIWLLHSASSLSSAIDAELKSSRTMLETLAASASLDTGDFKAFYELCTAVMTGRQDAYVVLFRSLGPAAREFEPSVRILSP